MNTPLFSENIKDYACNPDLDPLIIKEVYFPPPAPQEIATLIESGLVYQNNAHYEQSLKSFEDARDKLKQIKPLRPEIDLYFRLSLASVFESSG